MKKIELMISIVNWNTKDLLRQCIESINDTTENLLYEIIVVDNNSQDKSTQMVAQEFPHVTLIANAENRGFAAANNQAIQKGSGEYVLLLNPDIIVLPNAIQKMLAFIKQDEKIGAIGCKLLNKDRTVQEKGFFRKFPSIAQVFFFYTILQKLSMKSGFLSRRYWEEIDPKNGCEVDQPPGACTLFRRDLIDQIGCMDEGYVLFFEDVDFCFRIKKAGYRLYYCADAEMVHYGMQSFNSWEGLDIHIRFNSSLIIFLKKHCGFSSAFTAYLIIMGNELVKNMVKMVVWPFYNIKKNKKRTIKESCYFLFTLAKVLYRA